MNDTIGGNLQDVGDLAAIYGGVNQGNQGNPLGYLRAGANTANLLGSTGLGGQYSGNLNQYGGYLGSLAGLASGIQSGGWQGDTQAALNAGKLASQSGVLPSAYGSYLGYAAIPLDLYDFAKYGTASGQTGSDAEMGAETGASIGSAIAPGYGTLIGGVLGGAAGAIASAFGPGEEDPENQQWNQYATAYNQDPAIAGYLSPDVAYQNLAGVMDAKDDSAGHSEPIEQVFGKSGEQNLMDQMTNYINQEYGSGTITAGEPLSQQWSQTIYPWLQSKGAGINPAQNTATGQPEGNALSGDLQSLIGDWESGVLTPQSNVGINGQTIGGMDVYSGQSSHGQAAPNLQAAIQWAKPGVGSEQIYQARGGSMSNKKLSHLRSVADILKGPMYSSQPEQHFDGGGYVSYYDNFSPGIDYSLNSTGSNPYANLTSLDTNLGTTNPYNADSTALGNGFDNFEDANPSLFTSSAENPNSSTSGLLGALGAGGSDISSILSALKGYAPLLPLIGALTGATNPTAASVPSLPNNSITPVSTPAWSRAAVANPTNNATKTPMTQQDWYTYGERPEANFFTNNELPYITGLSPASNAPAINSASTEVPYSGIAKGGYLPGPSHVTGPGDGTSDDIPAKLSDGEYVMDAGTVSMLGNGSNQAGARRLDQLRQNIRKDAGKHLVKGKQFMKAKDPQQYMSKGKAQPTGDDE